MKHNEFVTSDTHFGHKRIIELADRPFATLEAMDQALIDRWNAKVQKDAVVYHLGDFAFAKPDRAREILAQLNGVIRLVRGNHDDRLVRTRLDRFDWVRPYHEERTDAGTLVVFCHYPFHIWNESHHGSWHLHGHSHARLRDANIRRLDIGVDTHPNYEPYSFAEIEAKMATRLVRTYQQENAEPIAKAEHFV